RGAVWREQLADLVEPLLVDLVEHDDRSDAVRFGDHQEAIEEARLHQRKADREHADEEVEVGHEDVLAMAPPTPGMTPREHRPARLDRLDATLAVAQVDDAHRVAEHQEVGRENLALELPPNAAAQHALLRAHVGEAGRGAKHEPAELFSAHRSPAMSLQLESGRAVTSARRLSSCAIQRSRTSSGTPWSASVSRKIWSRLEKCAPRMGWRAWASRIDRPVYSPAPPRCCAASSASRRLIRSRFAFRKRK